METNYNFPDDLVSEILTWLSVIQLLRFRWVCKSWRAIIDHPRFISKHLDRQYAILKEQGDVPIFFDNMSRSSVSLFYLKLASLEDAATQLYFVSKRYGDLHLLEVKGVRDRDPDLNLTHYAQLQCIGCAKGVFLFQWGVVSSYFGLWNPATREFKVVPRSCKGGISTMGFREYLCDMSTLGCDKSTDIKIISQIYRLPNETKIYYCYEIYSLKTNSWKCIKNPSHPEHDVSVGADLDLGVSINNIHYWAYTNVTCSPCYIPRSNVTECVKSSFILSFDFCNEMFEFLSQPRIEGKYKCSLGNYKGSLAFICYQEDSLPVKIWVLTKNDDHGIPSSWQHLFSIGPFREDYVSFCSFRVGGDMVLTLCRYPHPNRRSFYSVPDDDIDESDDGCLYDPATEKIIMRFGFGFYFWGFEYGESLLKLTKRI